MLARATRIGLEMEDVAHRRDFDRRIARQLKDAHGDRAIAEAAQRAAEYERNKDHEEAKTWRHVKAALKAMRGPVAS
jgi:hypothetical protein